MKVLHIINTLEYGGAQSVLEQLIRNWDSTVDQHAIVSLLDCGDISAKLEAMNIPVKCINLTIGKMELSKVLGLVRAIRAYKPDLVQTWLYHSDLLGGVAARLAGRAPVIWGVHHTTPDPHSVKSSTWRVIKLLAILSRLLPSKIICCSNSAYQTHFDLGYPKEKMVILYNGVDTDLFAPDWSAKSRLLKELGLSSNTKLIGMFARYNPQKDHVTFIRAAAILVREIPNSHFVLAGDGIDSSNRYLMDEILQQGVNGNFHLLGRRQDMPELHAGVDVVSLSSSFGEALPMTLCEGMSCGTLCVATNIGDIPQIIGETGKVVKPKSPQSLADAWRSILELPPEEYNQLSKQARQRIIELYNLPAMIRNYARVYREVLR